MKLSEKIQYLRKVNDYSQEELAAVCGVSRQSVSKWEADIALPEIEKIMILSDIFHVSTDVLLHDDLEISGAKQVHLCGNNAIQQKKRRQFFEGVLIKESIEDDRIIDVLSIHKMELWNTGGNPKYWTVLFFTSEQKDLPEQLAKVMIANPEKGGNWFADFKTGNEKYIVFRNKVLKYTIGNQNEKEVVCEECRKLGISDEQMNWEE